MKGQPNGLQLGLWGEAIGRKEDDRRVQKVTRWTPQ
jgi:hypothetical protein